MDETEELIWHQVTRKFFNTSNSVVCENTLPSLEEFKKIIDKNPGYSWHTQGEITFCHYHPCCQARCPQISVSVKVPPIKPTKHLIPYITSLYDLKGQLTTQMEILFCALIKLKFPNFIVMHKDIVKKLELSYDKTFGTIDEQDSPQYVYVSNKQYQSVISHSFKTLNLSQETIQKLKDQPQFDNELLAFHRPELNY